LAEERAVMPLPRTRHLCVLAAALALTVTAPAAVASAAGPAPASSTAALREVLFVGNNWDGTADVIESAGDFAKIGRIDVIPDKDRRMAEINADPIRWIYFMAIRNTVGEGHDQFVDDMYSTPDGGSVVVSRPSFADVVSLDLASGKINWRSEEHTSELQSRENLVCRLLLEKKNNLNPKLL